jgi:hypothetical protein
VLLSSEVVVKMFLGDSEDFKIFVKIYYTCFLFLERKYPSNK